MPYVNLNSWFRTRPNWVQRGVKYLINLKEIDEKVIESLVSICKDEIKGTEFDNESIDFQILNREENKKQINLLSIEGFKGINAIAPNQKIEFHNENLTIVYGQNGTGKSGYVRTLKHACGAKNPGKLHHNIYRENSTTQECTINIKINDSYKTITWDREKELDNNLKHIHIYDTDSAKIYVNEKNEVEYEPFLLQLFSAIIEMCSEVNLKINKEKTAKQDILKRPKLPTKYVSSSLGEWYGNITFSNTSSEVLEKLTWETNDERRLAMLNKDLTKKEIEKHRQKVRKKIKEVGKLKNYLNEIHKGLSYEKGQEYLLLNEKVNRKKELITNDAHRIISESEIEGVATDSWKLMWEYAKEYSEKHVYPHLKFPNTNAGSRCVLCQQMLEGNAEKRMTSFNEYVNSKLQEELKELEKKVILFEKELPDIDNEEILLLKLISCGLDSSIPLYSKVIKYQERSFKQKQKLIEAKQNLYYDSEDFNSIIISLDKLIDQFNTDESDLGILEEGTNDKREIEKVNLECKKWLSDHIEVIQTDLKVLKEISVLDQALASTRTTAYSNKKSELSEVLVTESYINRFNEELKSLCNNKIKVALVKDSTSRGRVYHKVILEKSIENINISDVLSEGEFRMVSLAAFLANVESEDNITSPFIFDDPISSLDQTYEENTVKRLVELTKHRQVIVFTHRLSLCSMIENELKKENIKSKFINLIKNSEGSGVPTETPFITQKPVKALNLLLNERVPKIRKIEKLDYSLYELGVGGICKHVRIITEHIIETHLINDVVKRYRRSVTTQNRLSSLAAITVEDCNYIDQIMTKFSVYEHSQPDESPATIPDLEELEKDIKDIKLWLEGFLERQKQYK